MTLAALAALAVLGQADGGQPRLVPRIAAGDGAALRRHFLDRTPVVLTNTTLHGVAAHWQLSQLSERFAADKVVVMTVPKGWRDTRETNQLHIDATHIGAMRQVRMPFADYAGLLAASDEAGVAAPGARRHQRKLLAAANKGEGPRPGDPDWDWAHQHVYVRHKMPLDHKGDTLGPALHVLLAADFPAPEGFGFSPGTLRGVSEVTADGLLRVHDTKIRSGSAGLYYPAHSDCYHNTLLVLQGRRRVRLLDQGSVWKDGGAAGFSKMLRLNDLALETSSAQIPAVLETVLESGEALYIPPTWLHDILYIEAGIGINQVRFQ